nr:ParA family protein [Kocuria oceani]
MVAAAEGRHVVLVDLDPRAASTTWFGVQPSAEGMHVGAILGDENPEGWAEDLAVPSGWHPNLRVIPSARNVSNREADQADHAELPLLISLTGLQADVVVIDCPNRQGGPLTLSALNAADTVVYAATATSDGIDAGGRGPANGRPVPPAPPAAGRPGHPDRGQHRRRWGERNDHEPGGGGQPRGAAPPGCSWSR